MGTRVCSVWRRSLGYREIIWKVVPGSRNEGAGKWDGGGKEEESWVLKSSSPLWSLGFSSTKDCLRSNVGHTWEKSHRRPGHIFIHSFHTPLHLTPHYQPLGWGSCIHSPSRSLLLAMMQAPMVGEGTRQGRREVAHLLGLSLLAEGELRQTEGCRLGHQRFLLQVLSSNQVTRIMSLFCSEMLVVHEALIKGGYTLLSRDCSGLWSRETMYFLPM